MAYKSDPLLSLLKSIKEGSLLLPHIQRKFVWSEDKMALLLDSLLNDYPIQTLLFWKTSEGIRVRKFQEDVDYDAQMKDLYDEQKSMAGVEASKGCRPCMRCFTVQSRPSGSERAYLRTHI